MPYSNYEIYDPVDLYKSQLKGEHAINVSNFFEQLLQKSGVDEVENKLLVDKIIKTGNKITKLNKSMSRKKGFRGFLIALIIIFAIVAVLFGIQSFTSPFWLSPGATITIFVLSLLGIVGFIIIIFALINKQIKDLNKQIHELIKEKDTLKQAAYAQMRPLNELYDYGISNALLQTTVPLIKIDTYFDAKRWDYLTTKYNLDEYGNNTSVLVLHTGEIEGNPFIIHKTLEQSMGLKPYTGTLLISWTESRYVNGKLKTYHRSQTLRATINKPVPLYSEDTYLIYGNEAADKLSFSRSPSVANKLDEKKLKKYIIDSEKDIDRRAREAISKGTSYLPLGNHEFEALFGAFDRDNEQQFRLLFTPLAQTQILSLIKDKTVGYGDDFYFWKRNNLNFISSHHLRGADIEDNPSRYHNFNLEAARAYFNKYNNEYFKHIFFTFAPLVSIPLYQQHKPHEYIYKDVYPSYAASWEHEEFANTFDINLLKHPSSITRNILKTRVIDSGDDVEQIEITAYGFRGEPRLDFVPTLGGDGRIHNVPVHWTEYLPVEQVSNAVLKVNNDKNLTYQDFRKELGSNSSWKNIFTTLNAQGSPKYTKSLIGFLVARTLSADERQVLTRLQKSNNDIINHKDKGE